MFEDMPDAVRVLHNAVQKSGVPLRQVWGGDRLRTSGTCAIEVLHPPKEGVLGTDNANSVVLAIEYAGRRLLLTGDLEPPGLNDVLAEQPLDVDVLMAPHHGSQRSDPPGMAAWSQPEYVVVSSGEGDDLDVVITAYAAQGGQVLPTSTKGAVMITVRPEAFDVDWWRRRDQEASHRAMGPGQPSEL
jgi:competence protein ComEC